MHMEYTYKGKSCSSGLRPSRHYLGESDIHLTAVIFSPYKQHPSYIRERGGIIGTGAGWNTTYLIQPALLTQNRRSAGGGEFLCSPPGEKQ